MQLVDIFNLGFWGICFITIVLGFIKSIRLVPTKSAYIVERLGKYHKTLDAGFHALIPFFDKVTFIQDLKERTVDVPPQDCFSRDEVNVIVDGVIYMQVVDASKASYGVTNYIFAAIELAQTTTRSIIGTLELDKTFEERDLISTKVVEVLNKAGETWGMRVTRYEIKNITPPHTVQEAMEKQVNAERERRAILARSEGDKQARINMSEGRKTELINISEGEMEKQFNEAEGRAEEILTIANASAKSIRKITEALSVPGGEKAFNLKLSESYLKKMDALADKSVEVIIPGSINNFKGWLQGIDIKIE
jgi:regulator of protease activity HflC (stomatin/prohibitin superfamily)